MEHNIKPSLNKNPKKVIIHAGTNNIPKDDPELIVSKASKLGEYIERTSNAKVIISSIIVRNDDRLNSKIEATNIEITSWLVIVRFLFTSCEGSLNERVSAANE